MEKATLSEASDISRDGQLVTFRLGREIYGIEILKIREVLHLREVTALPNAPDFIEGVIETQGIIRGGFTPAEARSVANRMRAGARAIPLRIETVQGP